MQDLMGELFSPKLSTVEQRLATFLNRVFPDALVLPEYPAADAKFKKPTLIITVKAVSDSVEGRVVTPLILHPLYTISLYCQKYANCRQNQETLVDAILNLRPWELETDELGVEWLYLENRVSPYLDTATEVYRAALNLRIHLTTLFRL